MVQNASVLCRDSEITHLHQLGDNIQKTDSGIGPVVVGTILDDRSPVATKDSHKAHMCREVPQEANLGNACQDLVGVGFALLDYGHQNL